MKGQVFQLKVSFTFRLLVSVWICFSFSRYLFLALEVFVLEVEVLMCTLCFAVGVGVCYEVSVSRLVTWLILVLCNFETVLLLPCFGEESLNLKK